MVISSIQPLFFQGGAAIGVRLRSLETKMEAMSNPDRRRQVEEFMVEIDCLWC